MSLREVALSSKLKKSSKGSSIPRLKAKSKKKSSSSSSTLPKVKTPRERLTADELQWKTVKNAGQFAGIDEGGGMMMFEELEDVAVEWNEDEGGRKVAKFVAAEPKKVKGKGKAKEDEGSDVEASAFPEEEEVDEDADESVEEGLPSFGDIQTEELDEEDDEPNILHEEPFDDDLLPDWKGLNLHTSLKKALLALGFVKPTEIQKRALKPGNLGKDVVGVAETGSGKTLAYSLPILSHLLRAPTPRTTTRRPLSGLVLCPTRELALQVVEHLQKVTKHALETDEIVKKGPPKISIGSVVGGLSAQKQKRIVERGCDILVATPGRLWDLIRSDEDLASGVRGLRFLVIDEADRMIENGHFAELENIVRLTQRSTNRTVGPDDDDPIFAATSSIFSEKTARDDMQTFVFSATLSKDLQQNLKKRHRPNSKKGKKATALEDLVERLDFRDENPEVIDLSPEGGVVKMLKESMVECVIADKDLYLYYFLLRYPGRSLVFVGSIDGIRRLVPLFETLQLPIFPLHSQLQQKQRLKNLDRFKSSPNGILIATDVAARGLDIPNVEHVIHFNLPRTADAYIHRSGRTARAQNPGFALQLCAPEEKGMQRQLMKSLGRTAELPDLPIENGFLPKLKERIELARDIEKSQHAVKKDNHDRNWLKEAAEAMDLDIDPSLLSEEEDADGPTDRTKKPRRGKKKINIQALKAELRHKLNEPLIARGISARYPTSGSKVIVDELLNSTGHNVMLGASTTKAYDEVHKARPKMLAKRKRVAGSK